MKKLIAIMAVLSLISSVAAAETVIVLDDYGNLVQRTVSTTVVQQTPLYSETYNYSNISAGNAVLAGLTTGIIGTLVYNSLKHHHKKPVVHHAPEPKHGGHKHKHH